MVRINGKSINFKRKEYIWNVLEMSGIYQDDERAKFDYWKDLKWTICYSNDQEYPYSLMVDSNEWDALSEEFVNELKRVFDGDDKKNIEKCRKKLISNDRKIEKSR